MTAEEIALANQLYIDFLIERDLLIHEDELDDSSMIYHELDGDWIFDENGATFITRTWEEED